jgi:hypothetical protein
MLGGTVLGEGTYGCAVNPTLSQGTSKKGEERLGKLHCMENTKTEAGYFKPFAKILISGRTILY